jgi:hypothetical protein
MPGQRGVWDGETRTRTGHTTKNVKLARGDVAIVVRAGPP